MIFLYLTLDLKISYISGYKYRGALFRSKLVFACVSHDPTPALTELSGHDVPINFLVRDPFSARNMVTNLNGSHIAEI